jgi:hypothetical protein
MPIKMTNSRRGRGWVLLDTPLDKVSATDFETLKDGNYVMSFVSAGGVSIEVCLLLTGAHSPVRTATFDVQSASSKLYIRPEAVDRFRAEYADHLDALPDDDIRSQIKLPAGRTQLSYSIRHGEEGEWLYRGAQFLCQPASLVRISFG